MPCIPPDPYCEAVINAVLLRLTGPSEQMMVGLALTEDAAYLTGLPPRLGPARRKPLAGRLKKLTAKD